ncbi:MAG: AzlD domain-containing protein [Ruminococcaceae bacterium]|nr:AzlD domain-containing protein [Oscillospiraceae bacterium]MBQ8323606.1 AzlD domain-containing protein [Clostridia bacterium]MBQ8911179.1 AzlD domain-containing protein [Clostridia bacterium]
MTENFFLYLAVMAGVTYLIRMLPLVLVKKKVENGFIRSFLFYVPYAVLGAMTVPAVFYATDSVFSAAAGLGVALVLALCGKGLLTVAVGATLAVYLWEWIGSIL